MTASGERCAGIEAAVWRLCFAPIVNDVATRHCGLR